MALRGDKVQNAADGIPKNGYFAASANIKGFDIEAYRKANKVNLYIKSGTNKVVRLFSAFTTGNFGFNAKLDTGDYGEEFKNKINSLFGTSWKTLISAAGKTFDSGNSWSGAFDAPVKPYIKGSQPMVFDLDCFLPLIVHGDGTDSFVNNIEQPLNDLLFITLPTRKNAANDTIESVNLWIRDAIDGLFVDAKAEGAYWEFVQNALHEYQDNYFEGVYMLNNPIQYNNTNSIILRVGPWRVDNVLIQGVSVEYSPLIYNDGETVYPAFAKARISFMTKYKMTPELINVKPSNVSEKVKRLVPKGSGGPSKSIPSTKNVKEPTLGTIINRDKQG